MFTSGIFIVILKIHRQITVLRSGILNVSVVTWIELEQTILILTKRSRKMGIQ